MWHEARKQERKIRGMMVDYKKRAERRREYYEKIKADPTQFLQLHGRRCKVHLDPAVAQAADSPANMMPWQGQTDILIDRFDGRAHLDHISEYRGSTDVERPAEDGLWEERQASYERYRVLVENDFLGLSEEKFLMQIYLEEQFGPIVRVGEEDKKKSADKKAAIGYVYEDSTPAPPPPKADDDESKKDSDSDIDLDVTVDVNLLTVDQSKEMNDHSIKYGMVGDDFISMMTRDKEEAESLRLAKEAEEEKAMYSGRKSRRERRAFREKKLQGRKISPPSYAARESPTYDPYVRTKSPSRSRSRSPVDAGKITYITSFGGDISDESGNERHLLPRGPGFASSAMKVIGPSLPTSKRLSESGGSLPVGPNAAAGPSLPSSKTRVAGNKHSITSVTSNAALTSSASAKRSRSRSRSDSSSSSRSRSRNRDRHYRRNRRVRLSNIHTRSHSRSPLGEQQKSSRRRRRISRTSSCSSSSDSRSSSSSSNSRSRSRTRSRSLSRSSKSRSRSRSSRGRHSSSSPRREKSNSRSPNGRSPLASSSSKPPGTHITTGGTSSSTSAVSLYYGRRRDQKDDSSSISIDDSDEDDDNDSEKQQTPKGHSHTNFRGHNVGGKAVYGTKAQKLTPQERLKRRMQAALNKQYKADKRAEMKKLEKQEQERQDREEELRELAIKLRRRERERRHRRQDSGGAERSPSDSRRGKSRSYSSSRSNSISSNSDSNSRSRSGSPSADPSTHSGSESSSDNSGNDSPKHGSSVRKSRKRSRSPLVHY